jgi:hypothetical protein
VQFGKYSTSWSNTSTPSSASKSNLSKKPAQLAVFLFGVLLDPEDEGNIYFRNVRLSPKGITTRKTLPFIVTPNPTTLDAYAVKVKLSLCLTTYALRHEDVRWTGCIDPCFLDLGIGWRWVVSFRPRQLYSRGKSRRCPLDRKLGGPQSRSGRQKV